MRRPKNSKSVLNTIIDLTPLLDVVFIFLLVIMTNQQQNNKVAEGYYDAAKGYYNDGKGQYEHAKNNNDQLDTYKHLYDYVDVINMSVTIHDMTNIKHRTINIMVNSHDCEPIQINPSNEDTAWEECRQFIFDNISNGANAPVILIIDDKVTLYRDEQYIENTLKEELESTRPYVSVVNRLESQDE